MPLANAIFIHKRNVCASRGVGNAHWAQTTIEMCINIIIVIVLAGAYFITSSKNSPAQSNTLDKIENAIQYKIDNEGVNYQESPNALDRIENAIRRKLEGKS